MLQFIFVFILSTQASFAQAEKTCKDVDIRKTIDLELNFEPGYQINSDEEMDYVLTQLEKIDYELFLYVDTLRFNIGILNSMRRSAQTFCAHIDRSNYKECAKLDDRLKNKRSSLLNLSFKLEECVSEYGQIRSSLFQMIDLDYELSLEGEREQEVNRVFSKTIAPPSPPTATEIVTDKIKALFE